MYFCSLYDSFAHRHTPSLSLRQTIQYGNTLLRLVTDSMNVHSVLLTHSVAILALVL